MKTPSIFGIFLLIFCLVACNKPSSLKDKTTENNLVHEEKKLIEELHMIEEESFRVSISLISDEFKINEVFEVEAHLQNLSEESYEMERRSKLFHFYIADENNNIVNSFVIPDLMISGPIQKKQIIKEKYSYKLQIPGSYDVWAVAKFSIAIEGSRQDYKIETEKVRILID